MANDQFTQEELLALTKGARRSEPAKSQGLIAPLWTVEDVAEFLRVPVQTLYSWRTQGSGPPARRVGKYLRYRPDEVLAWLDSLDTGAA